MFSIRFSRIPNRPAHREFLPGRIVAGRLNEGFRSAMGYWNADDYRRQWAEAIDLIIAGGEKAALITSIEYPSESGALDCWPLFREGQRIFLRYQLLIFAQLGQTFDASKIGELVGTRKEFSEDGPRISEWSFNLADLVRFRKTVP